MTRLRLPADTPQEWFATHLHAYLHEWDDEGLDESRRRWYTEADAFADDLALLRRTHAQYVGEGATAQAAAKWVTGEHVDTTAAVLAFLYVMAGAVVVDLGPPELRFGTHPDGWVQLVDLGEPRLVVIEGHPWAALPGVATVPDADALVVAFVAALRPLAETWYAAGKQLGKVGFSSLWAETSDAIGMCTMHRSGIPGGPEVLADLRRLLDAPAAPWRKQPRLWLTEIGGDEHLLGQKAGCCLAYLGEQEGLDESEDPRHRAYLDAFPEEPGAPAYCSTCCFRELADTEARLVWDLEWDAGEQVTGT